MTFFPAAPDWGPGVPVAGGGRRARPLLHLTPPTGWMNDPHGIAFVGDRYHLFFQHNPDGPVWAPAISWGHASSPDLLVWRSEGIALSPAGPATAAERADPGSRSEVGCWSGSFVMDGSVPTIVYTRVGGADLNRGSVALARGGGDLRRWKRIPPQPVLAGPPDGSDVVAFRDPFVERSPDGWRMVLGAGRADASAAALQYRSADLLSWSYDGVLAERSSSLTVPVWTGTVWECPQFFELDGRWVLLVSVWGDEALHHVCYAIGEYDGLAFEAQHWGRLTFGGLLYATSAFLDAAGRRCAISWLREDGNHAPEGSEFAGALSLPYVLAVADDRLTARVHPNLTDLLGSVRVDRLLSRTQTRAGVVGPFTRIVLEMPSPHEAARVVVGGLRIEMSGTGPCVRISEHGVDEHGVDEHGVDEHGVDEHGVDEAGRTLLELPFTAGGGPTALDVTLDRDILELTVTGAAGYAALRVPDLTGATITAAASGRARLRTWSLSSGGVEGSGT